MTHRFIWGHFPVRQCVLELSFVGWLRLWQNTDDNWINGWIGGVGYDVGKNGCIKYHKAKTNSKKSDQRWWPKRVARFPLFSLVWPNKYGLPTSAIAWGTVHYGGRNQNHTAMAVQHVRSPNHQYISSGIGREVWWRTGRNDKITSDIYGRALSPWAIIFGQIDLRWLWME